MQPVIVSKMLKTMIDIKVLSLIASADDLRAALTFRRVIKYYFRACPTSSGDLEVFASAARPAVTILALSVKSMPCSRRQMSWR